MPISKEKKLMILDLLEAHEIAIYELYNIFASKYSYYEDFWRGIAEEEKVHARWVRTIRSKAETGDISIAADVVSISTIENSLEYLQSQISLFSSKESTVDQAFILAMQIENSIIERGIFDIIQTDSEITKNTLLNLVEKNPHALQPNQGHGQETYTFAWPH
jgi:rubrerythrin